MLHIKTMPLNKNKTAMLINVINFYGCKTTAIDNPMNCKPLCIIIAHQVLRSKLYFNGTRTRTGSLLGRYFVYNMYLYLIFGISIT